MNARNALRRYVMLLADSWTPSETTDRRVEELYATVRAEVIAERDAEIVAWLLKKAHEYPSASYRQEAPADLIARLASKISRGAVRPAAPRDGLAEAVAAMGDLPVPLGHADPAVEPPAPPRGASEIKHPAIRRTRAHFAENPLPEQRQGGAA